MGAGLGAPAGSPTITPARVSLGPGGNHRLLTPAPPSRRQQDSGPSPKGGAGVSLSARAGAGSALRLRTKSTGFGDPPATHSRLPPLRPSASASLPPNSPRSFPTRAPLPEARPSPRGQAPSPPSAAAAGLGSGPDRAGPGVARAALDPPAPGSTPGGTARPLPEPSPRRRLGRKRERNGVRARDSQGLWGARGASTHSGKAPARCCPGASPWSRLLPGSPPWQAQARGTGEERSRQNQAGNRASGAAGKGLQTVLVSLRFRGTRRWRGLEEARERGCMGASYQGMPGRPVGRGGTDIFVFELGKFDRTPVFRLYSS